MQVAASARPTAHELLAELYHASYRRLVTQLYAFTDDLTEAQDVVAEAFARALARSRGLADVENPEAWLRAVAVNIVRRRWRRRQLLSAILRRDHAGQDLVAAAPTPERADLRDALAALPRGYREVIVLHYFADLPVEQIAAVLGVAVGTVKSRLSRGRAALAARLPGYESANSEMAREGGDGMERARGASLQAPQREGGDGMERARGASLRAPQREVGEDNA